MSQFFSISIFVFILGFSKQSFTQEDDSTELVNIFQKALYQPEKLDSFHTLAKNIIKENNTLLITDTYYFNYAKTLFQTGQLDTAYAISILGIKAFGLDSLHYKTSKFYNIKASVYTYKNDYKKAILEFQKTVEILEKNDDLTKAAVVKSNIANLFFSLTDYQSAYQYSHEAYLTLKAKNDSLNLPAISAIVGISALKKGDIETGRSMTEESLLLSKTYNNPIGLIVSNLSLGELKTIEKKYEEAVKAYETSLKYSVAYQQKHYIMLNKIGLLVAELNRSQFKKALTYGQEALEESIALSNENTKYAILKNIGYAYAGIHDYKSAFSHLKQAHDLYIETANIENKSIINELLIKYDSEKKEKDILRKNLELAKQEIIVKQRNNWLVILSVLLIGSFITYLFYRKRQLEKLEKIRQLSERNSMLAAIEGEEKERERLANELHDGIASILTGIRYKLEQSNSENISDEIIQQLQVLHEDTRRISHNLMPISLHEKSLKQAIQNYCIENSSDKFEIKFYDLMKGDLDFIPFKKQTIYRIIQELINNSRKHSKSNSCIVQISQNNELTLISIEDEGVGFEYDQIKDSQGLKSIEKRMAQINSELKISSSKKKGTLSILELKIEK